MVAPERGDGAAAMSVDGDEGEQPTLPVLLSMEPVRP